MIRITGEQRRHRLALRHRLTVPARDPVDCARALVALHSSDPATVFLSVLARTPDSSVADLETALYERRTLVRILGMRRTLWVVPVERAAVVNSSSTQALAGAERRRLASLLESGGISDDGALWYQRISQRVLDSIEARGEATAREITADVPELANKVTVHKKDGSVAGEFGVSTRVLFLLATEGKIMRAKPLGSWISSQYRWTTFENWVGADLEDLDREDAQDALLAQWLLAFGPGTETDIKWWTGWPVTQVRASLERVGATSVSLDDGGEGYVHPADLDPVEPVGPWVALLPSLDPTTMGWKEREWYLGAHADRLFDRNGNAGPTIWVEGRIVGGWAQRKSGEIVYETFDDIGSDAESAIEDHAGLLHAELGDVVVTPRFTSPHARDLVK